MIRKDRFWPPSLALTLSQGDAAAKPAADAEPNEEDVAIKKAAAEAEDLLDSVLWEVVRDENHKIVRSVAGTDPVTNAEVMGQAIVFRNQGRQRRGRDQDLPPVPEHGRARSHAQVREPR